MVPMRANPMIMARFFGAEGKPAGKPDAGGAAETPAPTPTGPLTAMQEFVDEKGAENFLFGPPPGLTKQ